MKVFSISVIISVAAVAIAAPTIEVKRNSVPEGGCTSSQSLVCCQSTPEISSASSASGLFGSGLFGDPILDQLVNAQCQSSRKSSNLKFNSCPCCERCGRFLLIFTYQVSVSSLPTWIILYAITATPVATTIRSSRCRLVWVYCCENVFDTGLTRMQGLGDFELTERKRILPLYRLSISLPLIIIPDRVAV